MTCSDMVGNFELSAGVSSTEEVFFPVGKLLAYIGMDGMDFSLVTKVLTGDVELAPGYQLVKVRPSNPEDPATVTSVSWQDATGRYQCRQSFSSTLCYWVQPGLFARVKPGGSETPGFFQASLGVSKRQCGRIVAQKAFEVYPKSNASLHKIVQVSGFVPTIGIDKFRGIVVATDVHDLEIAWFCRTAIDPEVPNDWQQIDASFVSLSDGNNEGNSGSSGTDLSLPAGANIATNSLVQLGLGARMKSGGSDPHGMFRVAGGFLYT